MSPVHVSAEPQVLAIKAGQAHKYPFLAHPPPQKKRPLQPLPSPPSALAAIATWAAHVQPGSPASLSPRSPRSPRRRPSIGRGRRPSITSVRATSASFLNIVPTPTTAYGTTPSLADFKADLTTVGYTSVFLQLPNTPISANISLPLRPNPTVDAKSIPVPPIPSPTRKPCGLNRFRSLSALRSHARSKSAGPSSPTKMKAKAAAVAKRKKAKYAALRPPPLANELALMQFADGGSTNTNIKRVMKAQAKANGGMGVGDVYRDGEGGIWWDQEEEWEYAHLLADSSETGAHGTGELQWITFNGDTPMAVDSEERRGSISTQDSDLDPRYIVQPSDPLETDDLVMFGSALAPLATRKPAMSVFALPSRPCRTAKHLRKPAYLVDVAFPRVPLSPRSPKFGSSAFVSAGMGGAKPMGKARRRPAPLKLTPPSPALKQPTNSPADADKNRKEFLASSFEPATPATPATAATVVDGQAQAQKVSVRGKLTMRVLNLPHHPTESSLSLPLKKPARKKPSMMNMMGLFKSSRKEDMQCFVH
ncbi:hypothetical protein V8B97DRAFT_2023194 [Scleroderma yunnanense]